MAGAGRELAIAHGAQFPAHRLLGDRDAELLEDPLRQIDQPPAHHAMDRRDRAALDHPRDRQALSIIELGGLARRFAVPQPVGAVRVEPDHPVPDDLKTDAADLGRLGAHCAVIDSRKSQKPSGLRAVFRLLCQAAELRGIKILAQRYRS